MDQVMDERCQQWARELFGGATARLGYPRAVLVQRTSRGLETMSDAAWEIDRAVNQLPNPFKRMLRVHYLHPGSVTERMLKMRIQDNRRVYYRLLDDSHVELREKLRETLLEPHRQGQTSN